DFLELHTTIKEKNGVRPAGDAMLLQPIPGDLHQVGSIRRAEKIAVRFHQATGIDPADSVKRFFGCPRIPAISRISLCRFSVPLSRTGLYEEVRRALALAVL